MAAPLASGSSALRMKILLVIVGCLFVALGARLWFLQVVNVSAGSAQVIADAYDTVYVPAPRGEILDRSGQVLVGDRDVPVIEVQKQEASDRAVVTSLADLVGYSVKEMEAAIDNDQYEGYAPVPVYAPATDAQFLYIAEHRSLFPGVTAAEEDEPYATTLGEYAGDVVGYVGQIDAPTLAAFEKHYPAEHYQAGDIVGLTGAEAEFQPYLEGTPGVERIQVNALGDEVKVASYTPPVPGDDVVLALDGDAQKVADEAILQGQAAARAQPSVTGNGNYKSTGGSVVAEDPKNGQVLALATEPTFNPNLFNEGISESAYEGLEHNPDDPLENRALQGQYAPGSTFKLVTSTVGLQAGLITPTSIFNDTAGFLDVGGQIFTDDGGVGSGYIDLPEALTVSSDNYFNFIGEELWDQRQTYGQDALQKVANSYGFGEPSGISLPDESLGVIPTPSYEVALHKAEPANPDVEPYWTTGDSMEMAIGQFQVTVTPLQLADAYATFANGGTRYKPQIALRITSPSGRVVKRLGSVVEGHSAALSAADRAAMIQGYVGVTHDLTGTLAGTGSPIFATSNLAGEDIAGKTGTAQVQCVGCQDTSVFTGFAPADDADYEVDCFMENSGYGESIAAPVVREVYEELYHKALEPVTYVPATGNAL